MSQEEPLLGEDDVRDQLNLIERIGSIFEVEDDWLAAQLANQSILAEIERRENELLEQQNEMLSQLQGIRENAEEEIKRSFPLEFSATITSNTPSEDPEIINRDVPFDGVITDVVIGWPAGADNLVGAQLGLESGERFVPRNKEDEYIAADDFTHSFSVREEVSEDDTIQAQYVNSDDTFDHFMNMFVTVREV